MNRRLSTNRRERNNRCNLTYAALIVCARSVAFGVPVARAAATLTVSSATIDSTGRIMTVVSALRSYGGTSPNIQIASATSSGCTVTITLGAPILSAETIKLTAVTSSNLTDANGTVAYCVASQDFQ